MLAEKLDVFCVVYLDDILIYSENPDDHVENVKWVLQKLCKANLFVNLQKCKFNTNKVKFLGYIISPVEVKMEDNQIDTIQSWPEPRNVRNVQVFIGFANFYWRFIKGFSKKTALLTALIKDPSKKRSRQKPDLEILNTPNNFLIPEARESFKAIKNSFLKAPILQHYDYSRPARMETDVSGGAIDGILTQQHSNGQWHPCAYYSPKMQPAEQNYETHNGELLAIIKAF